MKYTLLLYCAVIFYKIAAGLPEPSKRSLILSYQIPVLSLDSCFALQNWWAWKLLERLLLHASLVLNTIVHLLPSITRLDEKLFRR